MENAQKRPDEPDGKQTRRAKRAAAHDISAALTDYSMLTGVDEESQWKDFLKFMEDKYGTLPKAFEAIDANASGYITKSEFETAVCSVTRYCRVAQARRLFRIGKGTSDNEYITWKGFGVTQQQWIEHTLEKREQKQRWASTCIQNKGASGVASRERSAEEKHAKRIANPRPWRALSFWKNLPKGWGYPPNFDPRNKRVEHFDSF